MRAIKSGKIYDTQAQGTEAIFSGRCPLFRPFPAKGKLYKSMKGTLFATVTLELEAGTEERLHSVEKADIVAFLDACNAPEEVYRKVGVELEPA